MRQFHKFKITTSLKVPHRQSLALSLLESGLRTGLNNKPFPVIGKVYITLQFRDDLPMSVTLIMSPKIYLSLHTFFHGFMA